MKISNWHILFWFFFFFLNFPKLLKCRLPENTRDRCQSLQKLWYHTTEMRDIYFHKIRLNNTKFFLDFFFCSWSCSVLCYIRITSENHFIYWLWKMFLAHKQDLYYCLYKALIGGGLCKSHLSCMLVTILLIKLLT